MDEINNAILSFDYKKLKSNMKEIRKDIAKVNKKIKHNIKKWLVSDLIANQKISDSNVQRINKWSKDMSQTLYCTNKQIELLECQLFTAISCLGVIAMANRIKIDNVKSSKNIFDNAKVEEALNTIDSFFCDELKKLSKQMGEKIIDKYKTHKTLT